MPLMVRSEQEFREAIDYERERCTRAVAAERERCIACLKECAVDYANGDRWALAVELVKKAEAAIREGE